MRFSVVIPIEHERGVAESAVAAWVNQSFHPHPFEVVLVCGDEHYPPPSLTRLLRDHDRVVTGRFANLAAVYDAGIREARGELVFLTEAHCLPAPDCLRATDEYLARNPELAGACTHSLPACENAYARIDADTFYDGFREFVRPGDWRKLNVHGFALKRDVYLELGGFRHEYGRFAEMLLAAELRDAGHELGYAEAAVITHHYRGSLGELIAGIDDYVRGESLYRAEHPGLDRVGFTYLPEVADPKSGRAASLEREVARTLLTGRLGRSTPLMKLGLGVAARAAARSLGGRGQVAAAWVQTLAARVRCWRNRHDAAALDGPYRELIRIASVLSRTRALADLPPAGEPPVPSRSLFAIAELPEADLYGFHGMEWWQGKPFRCSAPLAAVRFAAGAGLHRVRLVTHGVRTCHYPAELRVAVNGERVEPVELPSGDYEFLIEPRAGLGGVQTLVMCCKPLRPWDHGTRDPRNLGLPVFAVETTPLAEESRRAAA